MKKPTSKVKKVKAWGIYFLGDWKESEGICSWGFKNTESMEIYRYKKEALERLYSIMETTKMREGIKIIPITVSYSLPTKKLKK